MEKIMNVENEWDQMVEADIMHCLFLGECKRSFEKESKSCRLLVFCELGKGI